MVYIIVKKSSAKAKDYNVMSFKYSKAEAEMTAKSLKKRNDKYVIEIIERRFDYDEDK